MSESTSSATRIEVLKRYLSEDPSDEFIRYALSLEYMAVSEYSRAAQLLSQLLNESPDYLAGYYMAGKTCEALSDTEKAREWYARGILVAEQQQNWQTLNELRSALESLEE
jgi:predicted Zn-dependent protease